MLCEVCNTNKLRKEFPSKSISPNCNHAPLHCLRCVIKYVEQYNSCSKCDEEVTEESPLYRKYVTLLNHMFPPLEATDVSDAEEEEEEEDPLYQFARFPVTIRVVTLGGDEKEIQSTLNQKVKDFKDVIELKFGVEPRQQKLLFNEKELESCKESYRPMTLKDYGVQANSTLLLMKVLQKIPDDFNHVIFDFSYGFPAYRRDFLDASALLYNGSHCDCYVDYRTQPSWSFLRAISHSGPAGGYGRRRGIQRIDVHLKEMPQYIDKVFFTLSSLNSPSIASYGSPTLHFYDARYPERQLCGDIISRAIHQPAIIMCCLYRERNEWRLISLGTGSSGNTRWENYCYLKNTISKIIQRGLR